jgi:hypothetical protein
MSLRIDRASFLTLTFGLAGLACAGGQSSAVVAGVVDIPPQPPQPADAGASSAQGALGKSEDAGTKLRAGPLAQSDDTDDEDDVGTATDEGGVRIVPLANSQGCGFVDPKTVAKPPAGCNDDQGTAGSCNVMKACKGFAFPKQKCEAYRRFLKPKVAQKALDCLAKLTVKQTCDDACTSYRCGDLAIKGACPDPSADASCVQITKQCSSVSMSDCRTYLAGLNAAGRAKMVACLAPKSGCGFGIYSCSESLY